jgi:hypothetical protein
VSGMMLIKSLVSSLLEGSEHLKAQVYRRQHKSFTPPPLLCRNYILFLVQNKKISKFGNMFLFPLSKTFKAIF